MMAPLSVPFPHMMILLLAFLALPLTHQACHRSCSCPTPREVHCTFRHLTSIPKNLPKDTERVNIGYNSIQAVGVLEFTDLQRLEMLMLHGNDIMTVFPGAFNNLPSLQILKLSYNKLKTIKPKMFEGLTGLVRLHLDHNLIEFVEPFSFDGLASLKLLQLEGNLLKDLHPHTFVTLSFLRTFWSSNLRHLHLADNQLEYLLPETLQHLEKLELLSLHDNPWTCDCQLRWLLEWNTKHNGVIKCKKDRDSGTLDNCGTCSSPQALNGSQIFEQSKDHLSCGRATIKSPLRLRESPSQEEIEPDLPRSKDLEFPLGRLTFVLSDSHANRAHVLCSVKRPADRTSMVWQALKATGQMSVNVSLTTLLECEIDRDELQRLWRLVAYYYESPAILERGLRQGYNESSVTFQYSQSATEDTPYYTELKGHLTAEPDWLLQPKVTLQLNRRKTTTKKLVLDFSTSISEQFKEEREDTSYAWAMIQRWGTERIKFVLEATQTRLDCTVKSSGHYLVEWMLPNLSVLKESTARLVISEEGTLVIDKTSLTDSGMYNCIVRTETFVDIVPFRLIVRNQQLNPEAINGEQISVNTGTLIIVPCSLSSVKPRGISWLIPSNKILQPVSRKERIYVSTNGSLMIEGATEGDSGEYSCLAANVYGTDMLSHLITVKDNKSSKLETIRKTKEDSTSVEDDTNHELSEVIAEEGSGYLEIKSPIPTQTPLKVRGRVNTFRGHYNQGYKGRRVKNGKRKPNKSVKELDPERWAQLLAKTQLKSPIDPSSQPMLIPVITTRVTTIAIATSTTTIASRSPSPTPLPTATTTSPEPGTATSSDLNKTVGMPNLISTSSLIRDSAITQDGSSNKPTELSSSREVNDLIPTPTLHVTEGPKHQTMAAHQTKEGFLLPTPYQFSPKAVTNAHIDHVHVTPQGPHVTQAAKPQQSYTVYDKNRTASNSNGTQRWRPPYRRRRPLHRRVRPINSSENIPLPSHEKMQVVIGQFSTNPKEHVSTTSKNSESAPVLDDSITTLSNPAQSKESRNHESSMEEKVTLAKSQMIPTEDPAIINVKATTNPIENLHMTQAHYALSSHFPVYHDTFQLSAKPSVYMLKETTAPPAKQRGQVSERPSQEEEKWNRNNDSISSLGKDERKPPWTLTKISTSEVQQRAEVLSTMAPTTVTTSLITTATLLLNKPVPSVGGVQLVNVSLAVPVQNTLQTYMPRSRDKETNLKILGSNPRNPTHGDRLRELPEQSRSQKVDRIKSTFDNPKTLIVPANYPWDSSKTESENPSSPLVPAHRPWDSSKGRSESPNTPVLPGHNPWDSSRIRPERPISPKVPMHHQWDSSKTRSENPNFPVVPAHHPWVIQQHTQKKLNKPNTETTSTDGYPRLNPNWFPGWPSIQGSKHYPSSPSRSWHFPHPRERDFGITNHPKITALTAKPTISIPGTASPAWVTTAPLTIRPSLNSFPNRTRDSSFLSRLRNRYRQSQLDALRLLGKTNTPKPRVDSPFIQNFPKLSSLPKVHSPVTPASKLIVPKRPHATLSVPSGSRLHSSHQGPKKLSTVPPFPDLMGSGARPRITSGNIVSISALAETDVFLPCESSGEPAPALSWTKISTGATIQANTKHGERFEVLKNGTFMIKNVQLQDRGQYLCTAQNKFGTDRIVITLAVLTQPPKIAPPNSADIVVYFGRPLNLECSAAGKPKAQISWILPDRTFVREPGRPNSRAVLLSNGTLSIQAANFSSKGDYKCIASNAAGADTVTYHIDIVALPPTINEISLETIIVHTGKSMHLHCTVKGEPTPVMKWRIPSGAQIKPSQFLGSQFFVFPNGTLFVRSISLTDSGKYECSASNALGAAKRVVQLNINQELPRQQQTMSQRHRVSAMYGSTVYLHCPESTSTMRGALWRLPSKTLLDHHYSPERSITAFPNGTLRILQLTEKDGGTYVCMFQKPNGEDMETFQVEVLMKPPKIASSGSAQKRVTYGESFQVDCVASGLPDPELSWSLPDGTMINNALQSDDSGARSRRSMFENGTLLLQQMGKTDEGDYTCFAKNKLGEDEMKVSVRVVADSPRILFKDQASLWGHLSQPVYMKCEAQGDPPPTIIWLSPTNEIISSSSRYQVLGDGTLVIRKLSFADRGKYACVARSSAGDDIKNVNLEVETREPQINGQSGRTTMKVLAVSYQTTLLDCKAEGMPEPQITWTTSYGMSLPTPYLGGRFQVHRNGSLELRGLRKTDEGRFECLAKNNLGEARLEIQLEVAALAEKPIFLVPNIEVLPLKVGGSELILECQARGKPLPEFVWVLPNSTVLTPGTKLQRFLHYPSNGTLRISNPATSDKGIYRCLAKNVAGQAEKRYILEPGRRPQIRGTSGSLKVTFGQNLNMPCSADGWPQATISWTLPSGLVLDKPQTFGRVTYLANGTLQLRETTTLDRGTYICKAINTFGSSSLSYPVTVMVYPPRITNAPPSIIRVSRGSPVKLSCVAAGIPKPDISWTLPGRTTLVLSNRFAAQGGVHMTVEGSLVIQNPVLMNSGIYKCNAKNALGTDFKATYLQVL